MGSYRETPDVTAAVVRLIGSVGRRVAVEDPDGLESLRAIEAAVEQAFVIAVDGLRETGFTDAAIGAALGGVSRQAVHQRFPRRRA